MTIQTWMIWLAVAIFLLIAAGVAFLYRRRRMQEPKNFEHDIEVAEHHAEIREQRDEFFSDDEDRRI